MVWMVLNNLLILDLLSSPPGIVSPLTSSSLEISNELDAYQITLKDP